MGNKVRLKDILTEASRQQLLNKSKNSDSYKDPSKGNRYTRRTKSKIAASVRDYNNLDMNALFKGDILEFSIPVKGETSDYEVKIIFENVLDAIQEEIKRNNNKLEFRSILRALIKVFNSEDVYVSCSCLHPDTRIKLLDGSSPTIEEMKERFESGEKLYVYSTDERGDFKPGEVENIWITKKESKLIKITLDNDKEIITTLDHRYMLRNGEYKEAQQLVIGESLMPIYFNSTNGYETLKLNTEERGWHTTYKLVAKELKGNEIKEAESRAKLEDGMNYLVAIHHKDFNKKNNNPENLLVMTAKEHWDYHSNLCGKNRPVTDKQREMSRENAKKRNANPTPRMLECRENFVKKGLESANFRNHDPECLKKQAKLMSDTIKKYYQELTEEQRKEMSLKRSEITKRSHANGCFKTEKCKKAAKKRGKDMHTPEREYRAKAGVQKYYSDPKNKEEHKRKTLETKILNILKYLIDNKLELSDENYEKYRKNGYPKITKLFKNVDEAVSYFNLNHKIKSIDYITLSEPIDVYDIKVKTWNNFLVESGVILHNCEDFKYRQAYWATKGRYNSGTPQPSNGKGIANPNDTKGAGCKHVNLCLANVDWLMKIASVINNYVHYAKDYMENNYALYIFPKLFGMDYNKAIQLTLDDFDQNGDLKTDLETDPKIINLANEIGRRRTQYKKAPEQSINPRYQRPKKEEPESNELELEFDNDNAMEDRSVEPDTI